MTSTSHWSVRTFLVWLVLACLLPGVIGAAVLFAYQYRASRSQHEKDMTRTARALVQAVDSHLLRVQALAQALSTDDSLAGDDLARFHQQAREAVARAGLGINVILRNEAGRQILNTALAFGQPLPRETSPEQVRSVFENAQPSISDLYIGFAVKGPIMSVNVPVIIDGKLVYALSVGFLPRHFNAILSAQGLPPEWRAAVLDSSGTIAGRNNVPEQLVGRKASDHLRSAMKRAHEGALATTTMDGIPVRSFFSRSPVTHFGVVIGVPRRAIDAALARTLIALAAGVSALFLIGLLLAWHMGGRIARAVMALTASAGALGRGEAVAAPRVHLKEAAEVGSAIARAATLLKERGALLEAREIELAEAHRLARFGTWHWDLKSGEVTTSASVPAIYGRAVPPFPQQRGSLLPVESWERVNAASQEAIRSGKGYDLEIAVNHGAGHTIWVNDKCEAVRDAHGAVLALRGTVQDITERRRGLERLRESEERFRLLADNIAQLAWMADADGSVFWYNRRWFEYTGTTMEQMRGRGWQKVYHPEHVGRIDAYIRRCVELGAPCEDTFPLRGADGTYRWFLTRGTVERDASGRIVRWFGTCTDITAQRETEEELQKFKFFSDHANDVHLLIDQAGRIRYANQRACERLGYSEQELLALNISEGDMLYPAGQFQQIFERSKQGPIAPVEGMHRRKDGATFPVEITVTVLELEGEWLMFASSRDISERRLAEQRLREAALRDPLTGLPNRAFILEYCSHLLAAAQRSHTRGALLFIDLNRFKPVNDLYGHETGDRVLQEVGKRLVACTRAEDLVGRFGGDEFVVVLSGLDTERQREQVVAQHVLDSISAPFHIDALELSISPSIGISYFPGHAADAGALIHAADLAMYQAKRSGQPKFHLYTPELDRLAEQAFSVELRLRNALKHGGLMLHYQPVIDIGSARVVGAEALLRLADRGAEPISPARFIPIAESAGLIGELGEWVVAEACRQQQAWRSAGMLISIAINVSPLQFRQRAFAEKLSSIVADSGIDPAWIEIEVTESTFMENVDEAVEILRKIKSLGVKVALDDFGTGYSSLSSLTSLPLDKLKVDQSFVQRVERDQASRTVTNAIIALGHSLRLDVVGEGIESEYALRYLQERGCNQAQGYWFSKPLPAPEFAQWHLERSARREAAAAGRV